MATTPILMPQLGESIAEATVIGFLAQTGDPVEVGQDILEVETNKATLNVTAPISGTLHSWQVDLDESYAVGAVLGQIAPRSLVAENATPSPSSPGSAPPTPGQAEPHQERRKDPEVKPTVGGLPVPAEGAVVTYLSPRLKGRMHELGLRSADLAGIAGSGAGGRITIQDFERFIDSLEKTELSEASPMRVAVADAMRRSWTRPLATAGLSVALDRLLQHRASQDPKPGPTLYAIRALAMALRENSAPAGRLIGKNISHPQSIDIGFAVEVEDGVLVPVLRRADSRTLAELLPEYQALMQQARERTLPATATTRSIATVTNFGSFGLTWATPIPLPEQNLVMGLGAGRKQPLWDDEAAKFVPQIEANLTLSFDHRVLDGGAAGRLLTRVASLMNAPGDL